MKPTHIFHIAASIKSLRRGLTFILVLLFALMAQVCAARSSPPQPEGLPGLHHTPNMYFDHYTFAAMWLPGLCLSWSNIVDVCQRERNNSAVMQHFSLHGLWPSLPRGLAKSGMSPPTWWHYGCYWYKPNHDVPDSCSLPPISLPNVLRLRLDAVMPLTTTCLDRHEYTKHIACFGPTAAGFFRKSITLLARLNDTVFARWISTHRGQMVTRKAIQQAFMRSFHQANARALELRCDRRSLGTDQRRDVLTQVWITIPSYRLDDFPQPNSLGVGRRGNCSSQILIAGG